MGVGSNVNADVKLYERGNEGKHAPCLMCEMFFSWQRRLRLQVCNVNALRRLFFEELYRAVFMHCVAKNTHSMVCKLRLRGCRCIC
eukprot:c8007_g1_i1 orf=98-355(-)